MTRFLEWLADYGENCDWTALFEGPSPAQNPPPLEADEEVAWNFYQANAKSLVLTAGLFPSRLARLGLAGLDEDIFVERLCLIHEKTLEIAVEQARRRKEA